MDADFIGLDDPQYVSENTHVLAGLRAGGFAWALTSFEAANWHPLTWLSHMLDVTLFGPRAGPHHRVNVALHAAAAVLLYLLLARLTGARAPALLTAALFAVHPLRVESVAWISERKDLLSGLLALLALLAYLRYVRRPGAGRFAVVGVALALGLMAKPMLVTLPFVLVLLDWWPLGRLHPAPAGGAAAAGWGRLLLEKTPLLLLSAASSVVTFVAQQRGGAMTEAEVFPLAVRLSNACVSYAAYLGKMLWPRQLIPFYPHPGFVLTPVQVALSCALLAGLTAVAMAARGRRPWLVTGWLWYLGMLVPVIGLVQVGLQGMADRYSYLPLIGPFVAISWEIRARAGRKARVRRILGTAAAGMVAALMFLTWRQSHYWKNTVTLFDRVVAVDSRNYLAFNLLGAESLRVGEPAKARALLVKSLAIKPGFLQARYNLGLALAVSGEHQAAIEQFNGLIIANPADAESLYNRGKLLLESGRGEEALRDLDAARSLAPERSQIHVSRGLALAHLDQPAEAAAAFEDAAAIDPRNAETRYNLGKALDAAGRLPEAEAQFRLALELKPGFAEAHNMLGVVLAREGRLREGIDQFREAVRLDPSNAGAGINLERAVGTLRNGR